MQFTPGKPPVGVLYDADFGRGIGQALGLCLLYGLDGKNECRVVSISVSRPNLRAAAAAEIFGRFYAGAVSGAFGAVGRLLPTGLASEGGDKASTPIIDAILDKKTAEGKPAYAHGLQTINDTAEPAPLLRNALTAQHDGNCLIVLNGPASNLAALLDLYNAKPWIERKARVLVIAGGPGFASVPAAARKLLAAWPTPIVYVPAEIGTAIPYPGASIEADFAWSTAHPLVDAYRAGGAMPYDASTTEMAAVLYAIRNEKEKLFGISDAGMLSIGDDGSVRFAAEANGKHRQLLPPDAAQKERIARMYIELASAKPVPRVPRFRSQQQQQQQQQQQPPAAPTAKPPAGEGPTVKQP